MSRRMLEANTAAKLDAKSLSDETVKAFSIRQHSLIFATVALAALLCSTSASASWVTDTYNRNKKAPQKIIEKPGKWIAEKSGVNPTVGKLNKTMETVTQTVKKFEDVGPAAAIAVQSIARTSDVTAEFLNTIKWPAVISAYLCALWLASLAFNGWKRLPVSGEEQSTESLPFRSALRRVDVSNIGRGERFLLIGVGSLLVFVAMFAIELVRNPDLNVDVHLPAFLPVAALRSAVAAAVLCWIPMKRRWMVFSLGIASSVVMFILIALLGPDDGAVQPNTDQTTQTP